MPKNKVLQKKNTPYVKRPHYIHFISNLPEHPIILKCEFTSKEARERIGFMNNIIHQAQYYIDNNLRNVVNLTAIDKHLEKIPRAEKEKDHHTLVDFYNSTKLKALVKKATSLETDESDRTWLRELTWIYVARRIFRKALIQTDYDTPNLHTTAMEQDTENPEIELNDFGRELF